MPRESSQEHTIVVVGAGTAGATVAARLRRAGARDVAVIDPYDWHYYLRMTSPFGPTVLF